MQLFTAVYCNKLQLNTVVLPQFNNTADLPQVLPRPMYRANCGNVPHFTALKLQ